MENKLRRALFLVVIMLFSLAEWSQASVFYVVGTANTTTSNSLQLTMTSGQTTYFWSGAMTAIGSGVTTAASNWISSNTASNALGSGSTSVFNATSIGYNALGGYVGNFFANTPVGGGSYNLVLTGFGVNEIYSNARVFSANTANSISSNTLSLTYTVTTSNSFVLIAFASAGNALTAYTTNAPGNFIATVNSLNGNVLSAMVAVNALAIGTYSANAIAPAPTPASNTVISIAAYVFQGVTSNSFTNARTYIDANQIQTITANVISGVTPYTYNFLVYNAVGPVGNNVLYVNSVTSNTFTFTENPAWGAGTITVNIIITDKIGVNSVNTMTYTSYNILAPTVVSTNALADAGQIVVFNGIANGGRSPYTYNFLVYNGMTLVGNMLYTGIAGAFNAFGFNTIGNSGNVIFGNVIITDSATSNAIANSVNTITTVNAMLLSASWTANTYVDIGQKQILTATVSGGTLSYTYNFLVYNSLTFTPANVVYSANWISASVTNTLTFTQGSTAGTYTANLIVTDRATTNVVVTNTITFTVYNTLAPTMVSTNALADAGQIVVFNGISNGGRAPYTYNFLVYNGMTLVGNMLYTGVAGAFNAFGFNTIGNSGNVIFGNVIITDSATANAIANSVNTITTVNAMLTSSLLSESGAVIYPNQYQTLTTAVTGGIPSFTYNFLVYNPSGALSYSNLYTTSLATGTFTFLQGATSGTYTANIIVTDSATANVIVTNTISYVAAATTTILPVSTGGTGVVPNGASQVPTVSAYLKGNQTGYTILNFSNANQETLNVSKAQFGITLNYITPSSVGVTINGQSLTLAPGSPTLVTSQGGLTYYAKLNSISYLPLVQTASVSVYAQSNSTAIPVTTIPVVGSNATRINVTGIASSVLLNLSNSKPCIVNMNKGRAIFSIQSSQPGEFKIITSNITSANTPPMANHLLVAAVMINATRNGTLNSTQKTVLNILTSLKYNCTLPSSEIAPYLLSNGTWKAIAPFSVNASSCMVSFNITEDPVIALFEQSQPASTTVTTVTPTTTARTVATPVSQNAGQLYYAAAAVAAVAVILLVAYLFRRKRKKERKSEGNVFAHGTHHAHASHS